jgi:hypothetical protein
MCFPLYDKMLHLVDGIVAMGEYAFHGSMKIDEVDVVGSDSDSELSTAAEALHSKIFGHSSLENTLSIDTDLDDVCLSNSSLSGN